MYTVTYTSVLSKFLDICNSVTSLINKHIHNKDLFYSLNLIPQMKQSCSILLMSHYLNIFIDLNIYSNFLPYDKFISYL